MKNLGIQKKVLLDIETGCLKGEADRRRTSSAPLLSASVPLSICSFDVLVKQLVDYQSAFDSKPSTSLQQESKMKSFTPGSHTALFRYPENTFLNSSLNSCFNSLR